MKRPPLGARLRHGLALARRLRTTLGPAAVLPWRPGGGVGPEQGDAEHLAAALAWLARAQDACGGRGVAALFQVLGGWSQAYPETSGYIIGTWLAHARYGGGAAALGRAVALGDWEVEVQTAGGGVLSALAGRETRVFNTGQVILGWCALDEVVGGGRHLAAAERAGRYLLALQEDDGRWERDTYCGARTYHARVDWALLRLAARTGDRRFAAAAARNLEWVLRQAAPDGWFERCGFGAAAPITHVLAYTLRGLLECHASGDPAVRGLELLAPVRAAAAALAPWIARPAVAGIAGLLPASFGPGWTSTDRYSCLTGNAQLSVVLARLAQLTGDAQAAGSARVLASASKRVQRLRAPDPGARGAMGGSHPLGGGYCPYAFPNWATKFLADALLFQLHGAEADFGVPA